jgi:hypothetical protein
MEPVSCALARNGRLKTSAAQKRNFKNLALLMEYKELPALRERNCPFTLVPPESLRMKAGKREG